MKKFLSVVLITMLTSIILVSANTINKEKAWDLKSNKLLTVAENPIKSIVEYEIIDGQTVSINTQSMLNKSLQKEDSVLSYKMEFSYLTNKTDMSFYEWRPAGWKPEGKYSIYFKTNIEAPDSTIIFSYDSIKSVLVYEGKSVFLKNAAGKDTSEIGYAYDPDTKKWTPGWRTTYSYNGSGLLSSELTYSWNDEKENWELISKYVYTYSGGLETVSEYFMWAESEWIGFSKTESTYYPDNQIKSNTDYTLDYMTFDYQKSTLTKYSYKNSVTDTIMFFDWNDNKWSASQFEKYNYLSGSTQIKTSDSFILSANKSAIESNQFVKEYVTIYNYDDSNTGIKQNQLPEVSVFPNPVNDYLNIFVRNPQNSQVIIFDIQGKIMKSEKIFDQNTKVGITDLTQGIYFVRVLNNGNQTVQKIVKY
jgi:hypothetical protein